MSEIDQASAARIVGALGGAPVKVSKVALLASIRDYGRLMLDAGSDQASDFSDRRRDGDAKEAEADELLNEIAAAIAKTGGVS